MKHILLPYILLFLLFLLLADQSWASFDLGVGTSSATAGRPSPALAIGISSENWGVLYRSVGAQTTIYAQNAWTLAGYKNILAEKVGPINASAGVGLGATYMLRTYRTSLTARTETESDTILGPQLLVKFQYSFFYLGFDTLLGLSTNVTQHLTLNFRDVSHFTVGMSL